jgi:hypothetical protein
LLPGRYTEILFVTAQAEDGSRPGERASVELFVRPEVSVVPTGLVIDPASARARERVLKLKFADKARIPAAPEIELSHDLGIPATLSCSDIIDGECSIALSLAAVTFPSEPVRGQIVIRVAKPVQSTVTVPVVVLGTSSPSPPDE